MWIGMLVTIKVEKTISMIRNIVVPFIEAKDYGNENIHTFEIVNADWVPEHTMLRRLKILEAVRMIVNRFFRYKIHL